MAPDILKSSLQDASFNIIFQIAFRVLTFLLNAWVLRHISAAAVGVMNVRLLLLESTILFLSREAFRRACLSKAVDHNWHQAINLIWLTVPLCCALSTVFGYIWLNFLAIPSPDITPYYTLGVWCIAGSCVLDVCCEPAYLAGQAFLFIRLKVVMDTIHVLVRTVIFTSMVLWQWDAVLAFSFAQVASVVTYAVCYHAYFHWYMEGRKKKRRDSLAGSPYYFPFTSVRDFLPFAGGEHTLDYRLARLTWTFLKQGMLKQMLTEGERYVMTVFSVMTFQEQGVYDVVNNLGSLAARFLFRPIEDSSYFYFSQMVRRDTPIAEQDQKQMDESSRVLRRLIRGLLSFGLLVLVMGQAYAKLLLMLYGGQNLLDGPGPTLLRTHCLSVLLLATNGVTECFALATMNTQQLDRYNYVMAALSIAFLVLSLILTTLFGGVGFIIANCCNMAARITHSIHFIIRRYEGSKYSPLKGAIPRKLYLISLGVAGVATQLSEAYLFPTSAMLHFGVGTACSLFLLMAWAITEKQLTNLAAVRLGLRQTVDKEK